MRSERRRRIHERQPLPRPHPEPVEGRGRRKALAQGSPRMTGIRNSVHAWLLVLPACVLLATFTHVPIVQTFIHSLYSTPPPAPAGALRRARQLRGDARRSDLLEGALEQPDLRRRLRAHFDRHRARHGAVRQCQPPGQGLPPARLFHADRAADDRRREHLAVLLLQPAIWARGPAAEAPRHHGRELARQPVDGALVPDRRRDLEGGRLLHDLLPGGAAEHLAGPARGRQRSRARRAGPISGASPSRC